MSKAARPNFSNSDFYQVIGFLQFSLSKFRHIAVNNTLYTLVLRPVSQLQPPSQINFEVNTVVESILQNDCSVGVGGGGEGRKA